MTAFIPQKDLHPRARREALALAQTRYQYNYTHVSPLAMIEKLPIQDVFSFGWLTQVARRAKIALANAAELGHGDLELDDEIKLDFNLDLGSDSNLEFGGELLDLADKILPGGIDVQSLNEFVSQTLRFEMALGNEGKRPEKLEAYASLFRKIGLPPVSKDYANDEAFAAMRVAGPNPLMLKRVSSPDERFPVSDADLRTVAPDDSLAAARAEGRLYLADYAALHGVECGSFPHGQKYLCAPLALFVVDKRSGKLLPVAIQCQQRPGPGNPVFNSRDGWNWMIAKTIVEIADGNYHEAVSHLGRTHLLMEPFVISTHRQLAPTHPLHRLLTPHFQGTLAINEAAWTQLIADKGGVDKLLGGTIQESRRLAAEAVASAQFDEIVLPSTFKSRGVDDVSTLPVYPYRDDALLYWNAIRRWVDEYTAIYYASDADVAGDVELQAWFTELRSKNGGRVGGLGRDPVLGRRDYLVDLLTTVIFTSSVQHAAVNFPQYDLMSYVPNMPLAGYTPAPTSKQGATEADYLNLLPPLDMAELQMNLGFLLGGVKYTTLGEYEVDHFRDPRVADPLARFQASIQKIGAQIENRNRERRRYEFLLPSGIPQSINI